MKLKHLVVVFENCDSLLIDAQYINGFSLHNIVNQVHLVAGKTLINKKLAKESYLSLNMLTTPFSILNELKSTKSITHYITMTTRGKEKAYSVIWSDDNDYVNSFEKHEEANNNLIIRIKTD